MGEVIAIGTTLPPVSSDEPLLTDLERAALLADTDDHDESDRPVTEMVASLNRHVDLRRLP